MSSWKVEFRDRCKRWGARRAYWKRHKEGGVLKEEKSPRAQIGRGERASSTRQGESLKIRPRCLPFLSSCRQSFLHFLLFLVLARGGPPFVPARCKEGTKTSRRLRRSEDRETEALPALAHRILWYRHRGLPFTLHLFYFIFRGINVFGALPVG